VSADRFDMDAIGSGRTEVVRYRISSGVRVLMASRTLAGVELWDCPLSGDGPSYEVDRGFDSGDQLEAFVEAYEREAIRIDASPMSEEGIEAWLELLDPAGLDRLLREGLGVS
jgi:hypothetical protein